jgi:hypothetical protein
MMQRYFQTPVARPTRKKRPQETRAIATARGMAPEGSGLR